MYISERSPVRVVEIRMISEPTDFVGQGSLPSSGSLHERLDTDRHWFEPDSLLPMQRTGHVVRFKRESSARELSVHQYGDRMPDGLQW